MLQLGCRERTQAKASFTTGSRLCLKDEGGAEEGSGVRDCSAQAALRPRVTAREPKSSISKQPRFYAAGGSSGGCYSVDAGGRSGGGGAFSKLNRNSVSSAAPVAPLFHVPVS